MHELFYPDSPFDPNCYVTIADLGHLTVSSDLVSQETKRKINDLDDSRVRALMYDKFKMKLDSLQLLVGRSAKQVLIDSRTHAADHPVFLIPRTNMELRFDNSILPTALNFTKMRLTGALPNLQLNFSDEKYHAIMRIMDYIFPPRLSMPSQSNLDLSAPVEEVLAVGSSTENLTASQIEGRNSGEGEIDKMKLLQRQIFQFQFKVDRLHLRVSHTEVGADVSAGLKVGLLADATVEDVKIDALARTFDLAADVSVSKMFIQDEMQTNGAAFKYLLSSQVSENNSNELIRIRFRRTHRMSPEFETTQQRIDQSLQVDFGAIGVSFNRATILALYEFALWTFAPKRGGSAKNSTNSLTSLGNKSAAAAAEEAVEIKPTNVKFVFSMKSLGLLLNNDGAKLAFAQITNGTASILLRENQTMSFGLDIGNICMDDCVKRRPDQVHFRFLDLQGSETFHMVYETFQPSMSGYPGHNSALTIRSGSVTVTYLEDFLMELLQFLARFLEMNQVIENARKAALEQANQIGQTRMHFDIKLETPVLILPKSLNSKELLIANLGEAVILNDFLQGLDDSTPVTEFKVEIQKIGLRSVLQSKLTKAVETSPVVQDLDIDFQFRFSGDANAHFIPQMEMIAQSSDIQVVASNAQFVLLMDILHLVTNSPVIGGKGSQTASIQSLPKTPSVENAAANGDSWTTFDGHFIIPRACLEMKVTDGNDMTSLCRVAFSQNDIRISMKNTGAMKTEIVFGEVTILDSRPDGDNIFREIIPAAGPDRNQFMLEYCVTAERFSSLLMTVDSTKVIIIPDFFKSVRTFFVRGYSKSMMSKKPAEAPLPRSASSGAVSTVANASVDSTFSYRVNVVDAEFCVLRDAASPDTDALVVSADQFVLAHEGIMSLAVSQMACSLCNWNKRETTTLHIVQAFDLTFVMDNRPLGSDALRTNISVDIPDALLVRISYHDILVVLEIVNRVSTIAYDEQPAAKAPIRQQSSFTMPTPVDRPASTQRGTETVVTVK